MNKRLIWGFELRKGPLLNFVCSDEQADTLKWESRFFWPANAIIPLYGLDDSFLNLSHYTIKCCQDCYLLLDGNEYNIKERHEQLFYKPLLQREDSVLGYGKKIDLNDYHSEAMLPGTNNLSAAQLLAQITQSGHPIKIRKERLIYKSVSPIKIKLELSRLTIDEQSFLSLSIEGRSLLSVSTITKSLLKEQQTCDYVNFLKNYNAYV